MRQQSRITWALLALLALASAPVASCDSAANRRGRRSADAASGGGADAYLRSVADTLNDLPNHIDLELLPAQPILTARTSSDGQEVRATVTENPHAPDGQINYLTSTDGNANFNGFGVEPGDIVRYYVLLDSPEGSEEGDQAEQDALRVQRKALELRVRRLDARDPASALIIEGGLTVPSTVPQRIEIWRYSDKRLDAIRSALNLYLGRRRPPSGWEPAPDLGALRQVVERANQWFRNQPDAQWQPDPLLAELPAELRAAKGVSDAVAEANLRDGVFADWEGRLMAQAVWCRDISQWARGRSLGDGDAAVAAALFDWTVRNVQLDRPGGADAIFHPWQAIVYGHGSAAHRAWVFAELCRHQRIDAIVLQPAANDAATPAPLLVGAVVGDQVYLFDPQLGLPLPGAESEVGTLAELAEDDALLRKLDVQVGDEKLAYALSAGQLKELTAAIVATPLQLSRRSAALEAKLEGENFVKLSVETTPLAARLAKHPQINKVQLWMLPFELLAAEQTIDLATRRQAVAEFEPLAERPLLWKARVLHFQGNKSVRVEEKNDPMATARQGHIDAVGQYQQPSVRPSEKVLESLEQAKQDVYRAAKYEAGLWLGLLSFDSGNFEIAKSWLGERTLRPNPSGRWSDGARYNLARTHEALGLFDEAVSLLQADPAEAPQRHGNLVRAARLAAADTQAGPTQSAAQ